MLPPTREHEILFTREERGRITALGRVAFSTVRDRDDAMEGLRESFDILSAAVTSWVDTEPSGWECWEQSIEDLNVGDLALYYQGEDMLKPWGILRLKVDTFTLDSVTHYDRHLVDEDKLKDRSENEES